MANNPPRLPGYIPPAYTPPQQSLSRPTATSINRGARNQARESTLTVAGFDYVLPVVYGEDRISGAFLVAPRVYSGDFLCAIAWCWGEIDSIQAMYINGASVPGGVTLTHYLGTDTQTPDATLSAAIPGFADAYQGIAYTVVRIPTGTVTGFPTSARFEAVIRGRIIRDPRVANPDPVSARYWRIFITETRTTSDTIFASIAEIELRATAGGADQTGSGTAYASSQTTNTASGAFDNNPATWWSSGSNESAPQWIAYDFGSAVSVAQITIQSGNTAALAARAPRSFEVQYSDDGSTWETAVSFSNESAWATGEVRAYSVIPGLKWTENPALCMADFIQSTRYGPGMPVYGVEACADRCDEIVAGAEVRCQMGLALTTPQSLEQTLDLFSAYAECLWAFDGDGVLMVPDAPVESPAAVLTTSDIVENTLKLEGNPLDSSPTEISIVYRESSGTEEQWPERVAVQRAPGVDQGEVPATRSDVHMPGIRRESEANRKALMRLRRLGYPGRYSWQAFDDGVKFKKGDVVQLPNTRGMIDRLVRILSVDMTALGIYQITGEHYDASMYSDDYTPGDTAQVPVGGLLPFSGTVAPDGYELFTDANGRYIVGAGGAYSDGETGGSSVIPGWSGSVSGGGHSGSRNMLVWGARGANPGSDIPGSQFTPPQAGTHTHNYTVADSAPLNPPGRESVWIKKVDAPGLVPEGGEVLSNGELISSTLSAVSSYLGRLMLADSANANVGSNNATAVVTIDTSNNNHLHAGQMYERVMTGPLSGPFENTYEYEAGGGPHNHDGTVSGTYTANVRRRRMVAYMASIDSPIQPGCVIGFDPSEILPPGWSVCDGTNGTVDLRGYFIERSSVGDAGSTAGNNTAQFLAITPPDAEHDHEGNDHGYYQPYTQWWHGDDVAHTHTISGSRPFIPPYYAMTFIQYTGVE